MIGQYKAIMKQKLLTLFTWTMPDGAKPLNPKDECQSIMLSAFTSCDLEFGFLVPSNVLDPNPYARARYEAINDRLKMFKIL